MAEEDRTPPGADPSYYRSEVERALYEREDDTQEDLLREKYLPYGLLAGGVVVQWIIWSSLFHGPVFGTAGLLAAGLIQALVFAPIMFVILVWVAQQFGVGLGSLIPLLLKIVAVTLGPAGVADGFFVMIMTGMEFDVWGLVAGFGFYAMFCIPLVALLFETGFHGSLVTVGLMFLPRVGLLYAVGALQPELFP